uniref:RNA polymerase sigma-70 factor n=1 Tax=Pedobacter schmidteae TaxID=2201271 RepID=UPI001D0219C1|nr:RNA polymerase sigma-70 factor [Pedobacter schmidteae]
MVKLALRKHMDLYTELTDNELTILLKKGDESAFTEIYNRYWDKLFAVAYHRVDSEPEAEEIVQDVFLSLWNRRLQLELTHSIGTYLAVAVKYQVINKLSKRHRKRKHLETIVVTEQAEESTDLWFDEKELRIQLERVVNSLPEKCRLVFLMSREEGKSTRQIAEDLNIAEKTVEAHMTRALKEIRNSLNIALPVLLYLLKK